MRSNLQFHIFFVKSRVTRITSLAFASTPAKQSSKLKKFSNFYGKSRIIGENNDKQYVIGKCNSVFRRRVNYEYWIMDIYIKN